jgi:bifunctional DNase/RNase
MNNVLLNVLGVSFSQTQTGGYVLVLGEDAGNRRIPIIIGALEAQAIVVQMQGTVLPRPLTHDLFHKFALEFGLSVEYVCIFRLEAGVFYSKVVCTNGTKQIELDARASDAVSLALRFNSPIYAAAEIVERAGIIFTDEPQPSTFSTAEKPTQQSDLKKMTVSELKTKLNIAIKKEDYEMASKLRDELNQRQ